jgi:hypothetical protein
MRWGPLLAWRMRPVGRWGPEGEEGWGGCGPTILLHRFGDTVGDGADLRAALALLRVIGGIRCMQDQRDSLGVVALITPPQSMISLEIGTLQSSRCNQGSASGFGAADTNRLAWERPQFIANFDHLQAISAPSREFLAPKCAREAIVVQAIETIKQQRWRGLEGNQTIELFFQGLLRALRSQKCGAFATSARSTRLTVTVEVISSKPKHRPYYVHKKSVTRRGQWKWAGIIDTLITGNSCEGSVTRESASGRAPDSPQTGGKQNKCRGKL